MTTTYRPPHLSASSVRQYLRCPANFYWNRVIGLVRPPTVAMLFGSAIHFALQAWQRDEDSDSVFKKHWKYYVQQILEETGVEVADSWYSDGLKLIRLYQADPMDGKPEVRWQCRLPGVALSYMGYFDLDGDGFVEEIKTSGWPWKPERVEEEFQGRLYRSVYQLATGKELEHLTYTILSVSPKPTMTRYRLEPSEEVFDSVVKTSVAAIDAIAAGVWDSRCPKGQCSYPIECGREEEMVQEERRSAVLISPSGEDL